MRIRSVRLLLAALAVPAGLAMPRAVAAYASFPPTDQVGIDWPVKPPPRRTCNSVCHLGAPGSGSLSITGLPAAWEPGRTYSLLIELVDPLALKFGFELTVLDDAFVQAGRMVRTDVPATALSTDAVRGVAFLLHTGSGTDCNLCPSRNGHRWMLDWEAPAASPGGAAGAATFYACGNGANGDDTLRGDHIYCITASVPEIACPPQLGPVAGLVGARIGADIVWEWRSDPLAVAGYHLYAVATREEIPAARGSSSTALGDCPAPTSADWTCTEALAAADPESWFYQMVAVCAGGIEGPN